MEGSDSEPAQITQKEVLDQIEKTKNYVKEHKDELPNFLYSAMNTFSTTLLAYKDAKGEKGWTKDLDWTEGQKQVLEECLPRFFEVSEKKGQDGGAYPQLSLKPTTDDSLVQMAPAIDPTKISLDSAFYGIRNMLASLDAKNKQLAKILGPTAIINSMKEDPHVGPRPPYLPIRLQFPARAILPMINAILESIRLFVSVSLTNSDYDNKTLRQVLSIVLGIFDISRGEWKDGILSFLGAYSRNMLLMGFLGKTSRWVYNFISPDIQNRIEEDLYAGGKSMFVGFWLWALTVVSPDFVRIRIQELMDKAKENIENFNKKIDDIESKAQQEAATKGATVKFPRVPMDRFPSFDDIQNLQSILHQPAVFCNPSFQSILKPALKIPPLRIALELMNIPTLDEKIAEYCKNVPTDIVEAATQEFAPTVIKEESDAEDPKEPEAKEAEPEKPEAKEAEAAEAEPEKAEVKEEVKEEPKEEVKEEAKESEEGRKMFAPTKVRKIKKGGSRKKSKKGSLRPQGRKEGLATSPLRRTRRRVRG
jgi:hypothetical protein